MLTPIHLHGHLGEEFGERYDFDVRSPAEAVRLLAANFPTFEQHLMLNNLPGYHVIVGKKYVGEMELSHFTARNEIRFVPVIAGGDGKGLLSIVAGVALIAFSGGIGAGIAGLSGASVAGATAGVSAFGLALTLGGVSQLLFKPPKPPKASENEKPENKPSFVFDGPVNTIAQGHCVPVGYGEGFVGSQVISAGIVTEEVVV